MERVIAYVYGGSGTVGSAKCAEGDTCVRSGPDGNGVALAAGTQGGMQVLLLVGQPLREPIARYGPFVMNENRKGFRGLTETDVYTCVTALSQ